MSSKSTNRSNSMGNAAISILFIAHTSTSLFVEKKVTAETILPCQTETCQKAATMILGNMDRTVQPCDNFYQFACGNYKKNLEFPDDAVSYSLFQDYSNEAFTELKTAVEEQITEGDPEAFKKLQMLYHTCMNESHINKNSETEFQQMLNELGGWPVLIGELWNGSNINWIDLILRIDSMGFNLNPFFSMEVFVDSKNSSGYVIQLSGPTFGIDQEYLQKVQTNNKSNKIVNTYLNYMVGVAKLLGANGTDLEEELGESLEFEKSLANISSLVRLERSLTKLYNPTTIAEMQAKYPYIQWFNFLQELVSPVVQLSLSSDRINIMDPDYFEKFPEIVAKFSNRTLANYAFWRLVQHSLPYLSTRLCNLTIQLSAELYGVAKTAPRWKKCIATMKRELPIATGALYVRKNVDRQFKQNVTDLFYRIRGIFNESLKQADWMDNKTRMAAAKKLENMIPFIAYPDEFLDDEKLDAFHENVRIAPNKFLKSSLSLQSIEKRRSYGYLRQKVNRSNWTQFYGTAVDVNAYNDLNINAVDIKAGILQGMMFDAGYPKYINYGGIGNIVGHEISHGFDDQGKLKDKDGNIKNWWDAQTEEQFLNKTRCVIDQYNNYSVTVDGNTIQLDGHQTIGENIADIGGLKTAYLAFENWQKEYGDEPPLPGLEMFTPQQMFWISYANSWCATYRPEYLKDLIETETHTYELYRVIGSVSNRPEFSRDFNCPDNSLMNPKKKCNVW